tara:strand:- start:36 stop:809 length:774 start_codon:yes stop_codon:yes gene_type:complete
MQTDEYKAQKKLYREENRVAIAERMKRYNDENRVAIAERMKRYNDENKVARAEYQKHYYEKNKESVVEQMKCYREENKDAIAEYQKHYREKNKESIAEKKKRYYEKNKDAMAEKQKRYNQANKEVVAERQRRYKEERRATDPLFKLVCNIRVLIRNSFRNGGFSKKSKTAEILGCSFEEFHQHIESQFTDSMSWQRMSDIHIDHRLPVSAANTEAELLALNHYTNLQPMWAAENMAKSDSYCTDELAAYFENHLNQQ